MYPRTHLSWRRLAALALALAAWAAHASNSEPRYQTMIDALTRAHAAVVGVQVVSAEGARSAETLGRERSGSGVVIGPDGLILTIGYLMLEADAIQVVTQDNRTLPARAVAYDIATGFGLIRPLLPLPCRHGRRRSCRCISTASQPTCRRLPRSRRATDSR